MIKLAFCSQQFPRTTTRQEWKTIDRWRRITEKELAKHNDVYMSFIDDVLTFGSATMRHNYLDKVVNPPIMIHPKQLLK